MVYYNKKTQRSGGGTDKVIVPKQSEINITKEDLPKLPEESKQKKCLTDFSNKKQKQYKGSTTNKLHGITISTYVCVKMQRVPQFTYPKTSHHKAAKTHDKKTKVDKGSNSISEGEQKERRVRSAGEVESH